MANLTSLDILYFVLSFFITIIWTLLAIVLFKLIKILDPIVEMAWYYKQFKLYLSSYRAIPWIVKERIFEIISNLTTKKKRKKWSHT